MTRPTAKVLVAFFLAGRGRNCGEFSKGLGTGCRLSQFRSETANEFRRQVGDIHALGNQKLAAQDGASLVVVR